MQTGKGDTMARLRAGHARPLRTAVNGLRTRWAREAAARPYGWRKVRGQGCRGRRPRRPAEGSRPLPTMQTGKGDTMARLRAGHARPLRTAVNGLRTRWAREAAARPYGWRKVRGQGCRGRRPRRPAEGSRPLPTMQTGKGDTMARLRAGHARPLRTAVNGLRTRWRAAVNLPAFDKHFKKELLL